MIISGNLHAEDATKKLLDNFFNDLKTLSANFVQTVRNSQLNATEKAEGKLWIQRPGKFRWNYETPYWQEIVSNGKKIWVYDADLEQVTVKKIDMTLGNTPALLLSNDRPIDESFIINSVSSSMSINEVELIPKDSDAGFKRIFLLFSGGTIKEMQMEDNLGQTTLMVFHDLKRNSSLDDALFQFVPPKGADIFDNSK